MDLVLESEAKTKEFSKKISALVVSQDVILLSGPLGAGKTFFVKGLAAALGVLEDEVVSPTFVIAQQYQGKTLTINHLDLYRLDEKGEVEQMLQELPGQNEILLIEWGEKADIFDDCLKLTFDYDATDENKRLVSIEPYGKNWENRIQTLRQ